MAAHPQIPDGSFDDEGFQEPREAARAHHPERVDAEERALTVERQLVAAARSIAEGDDDRLSRILAEKVFAVNHVGRIPCDPPPDDKAAHSLRVKSTSLLHIAAVFGNAPAIRILGQHGAKAGLIDSEGETPLSLALLYQPQCVMPLLVHGKERNLRYIHPRTGRNLLFDVIACPHHPHRPRKKNDGGEPIFARLPILHFMVIEYGMPVRDVRDAFGMTALQLARENYLKLGYEDQDVISFIENPPAAKTTFAAVHTRRPREFFRHPYARILVLLLLGLSHALMYASDHLGRGGPLAPRTAEMLRYLRQLDEHVRTTGISAMDAVAALGSPPTMDNVSLALLDAETLVTVGRGPVDAEVNVLLDVCHLATQQWPTHQSNILAAKLLCIIVGAILGGLFCAFPVHWILRDVFGFRIFGAAPDVDSEKPNGELAADHNPVPSLPPRSQTPGAESAASAPSVVDVQESSPTQSSKNIASKATAEPLIHQPPLPPHRPVQDLARSRGRLTLLVYGLLLGIYAGGHAYNGLLERVFARGNYADPRRGLSRDEVQNFMMKPYIHGVTNLDISRAFLATTALVWCALVITVLDTMMQSVSQKLFIPTQWYDKWMAPLHASWSSIRIGVGVFWMVVSTFATVFVVAQDFATYSAGSNPKEPTPGVFLKTNHFVANIFLASVSLLLCVFCLLQDWALPELQSLAAIFGTAAEFKLGGLAKQAWQDADQMREKQEKERSRSVKRTTTDEEESHRVAISIDGGCASAAKNAFALPLLPIHGNVHWLLAFLVSVLLIIDCVYFGRYTLAVRYSNFPRPLADDVLRPLRWLAAANNTDPASLATAAELSQHPILRPRTWQQALAFAFAVLPALGAGFLLFGWLLVAQNMRCRLKKEAPKAAFSPISAPDGAAAVRSKDSRAPACGGEWTTGGYRGIPMYDAPTGRMVAEMCAPPGAGSHSVVEQHRSPMVPRAPPVPPLRGLPRSPQRRGFDGSAASASNAVYRGEGNSARLDLWSAAYRDDVMAIGTILDREPSLLDQRGGVGLRIVAQRGKTNAIDSPSSSSRRRSSVRPTISTVAVELCDEPTPDCAATALHYGVVAGAESAVGALLARGANPKLRTLSGMCTPAQLARITGNDGMLLLFE